jgi:hypothetical protein
MAAIISNWREKPYSQKKGMLATIGRAQSRIFNVLGGSATASASSSDKLRKSAEEDDETVLEPAWGQSMSLHSGASINGAGDGKVEPFGSKDSWTEPEPPVTELQGTTDDRQAIFTTRVCVVPDPRSPLDACEDQVRKAPDVVTEPPPLLGAVASSGEDSTALPKLETSLVTPVTGQGE